MIQIDIEMPKSCYGCPFAHYDSVYSLHCPFDDKSVDMYPDERPDNCPLKESVIDWDALILAVSSQKLGTPVYSGYQRAIDRVLKIIDDLRNYESEG